jgi:hypothetical protein
MMDNIQQSNAFTFGEFNWWIGKVVSNEDTKKLGRVKVRIYGYHNDDIKDESLPWAFPVQPITSAALGGVGFSPTGLIKDSTVIGFFADGDLCQMPIVLGSLGGIPEEDGLTPTEPDTNRLARKEKIEETIVKKKKENLQTAKIAFGGSWTEPVTPYNARYPLNHTYATPNGIIYETDDSNNRIAMWHPSGTFMEYHPDGKRVYKNMNDDIEIIYKDKKLLVKGNCNITVEGNANILVQGNAATEIMGNQHTKVHGSRNTEIMGNDRLTVYGNQTSDTKGNERRRASNIYLN